MARCRSCDAEIRWATTDGGIMPVNLEPVAGGNVELVEEYPGVRAIVHAQADLLGGERFVSHFATCPQATEWRREHNVSEPMRFAGATIAEDPDAPVRLTGQMLRVFSAMSDGAWWTLPDLARVAQGSEASVSARIRDLRKAEFGGHTVERAITRPGQFRYKLVLARRQVAS